MFGNPYDQRRPLLPYDMNEKWVGIVFVDIPSQAFQSLFLIKLCKILQIFDDFLSALFMDKRRNNGIGVDINGQRTKNKEKRVPAYEPEAG